MDATLVATLTTPPGDGFEAELAGVAWLEVRADLVGDLPPEPLRARFHGKLLYTLRSRTEGGAWEGSAERRKRRLLEAAERYDLVDLECVRDLTPDVLKAIPAQKRVISWHGPAAGLPGLKTIFEKMSAADALLYKMVPTASQSGEEIPALLLLDSLKRRDVAAFAVGPIGAWTRLVAPRLGAPVIYGALGDVPGAPGQITLRRLREDFGLPALPPVQRLFGVVGNPVLHSLSPRLHNAAYRELGLPFLYLPFHVESFGDFWLEVVESGALEQIGMPLRGLSVTTPHKEAALAVAAAPSPRAELIGAANTLVNQRDVWEAETTDPEGVVLPLQARGLDLSRRNAAVVGAGGAGRSAAEGLAVAGARVTLVNRTLERGQSAADHLKIPFLPLEEFQPSAFDLIVNATSLGRGADDPLPFAVDALRPETVVVDLVYRAEPTPLLSAAAERGLTVVDGREVLVYQALGQFRWMTGREMPLDPALRIVGLGEVTP
ncbi:MAG TPA: type I 3-dehydroquinate dehydratase [Thermoanaerobaculia bacterium]|nr:type I 3-dehydroquinate dehydratase [Thermoanaerobaculia bacterium]